MLVLAGLTGCQHQPVNVPATSVSRQQDLSSEWIYSEPVTYKENHDPSMIWLQDGRELQVCYGKISWQEVEKWPVGRKLTLAYSERQGCVLIDGETLAQFPVIRGWGHHHPLDLLLKRNLELAVTTMDIVEAYDTSIAHWQAEIERFYRQYLNSEQLPSKAKEAIRSEQDLWARFREGHIRATGELYSVPSGTMWTIKGSEHCHALIRGQAVLLQELVEVLALTDQ